MYGYYTYCTLDTFIKKYLVSISRYLPKYLFSTLEGGTNIKAPSHEPPMNPCHREQADFSLP